MSQQDAELVAEMLGRAAGPGALAPDDRVELAGLIRRMIVDTVSANAGHLSSNLGVVELSIALHSVFDFRRDRLVLDVGHQCYPHKILSGRAQSFHTVRTSGGISGFPSPAESDQDPFMVGHAGNSLSNALGLKIGMLKRGIDDHVVALIGDGSMAGGLPFEAMNHIGHLKTPLIVVLNDNNFSISETVGAIANYLTMIRHQPIYRNLKQEILGALGKVPLLGQHVEGIYNRLNEILIKSITTGDLFETLGLKYIGPVDGHNIEEMIRVFTGIRAMRDPVLVHVHTEKGRGFEPAKKNPTAFHSSPKFALPDADKVVNGTGGGRETFTDVFGATMLELGRKHERLVAITAAMPDGTGLAPFGREFPDRYFDVGICEEHAASLAAGLAKGGMRPVVAIYSTFLQRSYDMLIHDVALNDLPVVFAVDRAGFVGTDGPTHHGVFDIAYLRGIPNFTVMAPKDADEFRAMLTLAVTLAGPAAIRYPRDGVPTGCGEARPVEFGRSEVLAEGKDVLIIAAGAMAKNAFDAVEILRGAGLDPTLINARFIKPLDRETLLEKAENHKAVFTVEDGTCAGGFGSAVIELLCAESKIPEVFGIVAAPDEFVTHAPREELIAKIGLDAKGIARTILNAVSGRIR